MLLRGMYHSSWVLWVTATKAHLMLGLGAKGSSVVLNPNYFIVRQKHFFKHSSLCVSHKKIINRFHNNRGNNERIIFWVVDIPLNARWLNPLNPLSNRTSQHLSSLQCFPFLICEWRMWFVLCWSECVHCLSRRRCCWTVFRKVTHLRKKRASN